MAALNSFTHHLMILPFLEKHLPTHFICTAVVGSKRKATFLRISKSCDSVVNVPDVLFFRASTFTIGLWMILIEGGWFFICGNFTSNRSLKNNYILIKTWTGMRSCFVKFET